MQLLSALWRDEVGLVVSTELIVVGTVVVLATLVGVFLVRIAVTYTFMGVATDFAREQPFAFDTEDLYQETEMLGAQTVFQDENNDGLVGFKRSITPAGPPLTEKSFDDFFPGLVGPGKGERPVTIQPKAAKKEGA